MRELEARVRRSRQDGRHPNDARAELEVGQKFLVLGNGISTGRPADPGEYFFVGTKTDSLPMARTAIRPGRTAVHS